ncbi:MAG: FAD-dependent oxidoreductase, partial [Actinomycetota bacterium]|nr:FAD-dependent oxidoreductase [Actinomycetota bacterium]
MDDLLVVGGGPVGLATALHAARAGLTVSVLERRVGPVDKACGEGLMPAAVADLHDLGVAEELMRGGMPITGITYVSGHRQVTAPFSGGEGLGVRRTHLASVLAAAVARAGISVHHGTAVEVLPESRRVGVVEADGRARFARHVVAADGLHSPVRHLLGLDARPPRRPEGDRHGLRRHVRVAPWTSCVEVHWGALAEAYV